jgi:hypothetical protein
MIAPKLADRADRADRVEKVGLVDRAGTVERLTLRRLTLWRGFPSKPKVGTVEMAGLVAKVVTGVKAAGVVMDKGVSLAVTAAMEGQAETLAWEV